ncbi:MAG: FAD-binding oxidoreductase [Cyanobacteria bacterium]|nr:FAD-binding oxidoreductase [Cyanobacteriota bacterium]MDW8201443.1 FAD-binding oxidoreductase [Cyanobacteriota bacterium SKYGB_h_bin112]
MQTYDWIVIGNGIAGAALSYELAKQGCSVLVLTQAVTPAQATRYSYGGIAFWAGTTDSMRQLSIDGYKRHQVLSDELGMDTQLRELDLVMPIPYGLDPEAITATYATCAIPPRLITVNEACELEPLLNPSSLEAALTVRHGHILPEVAVKAYNQAFTRLGGIIQLEAVQTLWIENDRILGVKTVTSKIASSNVAICAGGLSRQLGYQAGVQIPHYFTHAEVLETIPVELKLRSLIMPANLQRFAMEAEASRADLDPLWDEPGHEPAPAILDVGACQFLDGRIRIGQVSRVATNPTLVSDPQASEAVLRRGIGSILPALAALPATWHHCLVAFCRDRLPLVGALSSITGLHVFVGFSNPMVIVPILAERLARQVTGQPDPELQQFSPDRFREPSR